MEAQDGGSVGGLRLVDCCRSRYGTNKNVSRRLGEVKSEGEEHNMIVSLIFFIFECIRGSYNEGFVGQVRDFVPI